MAGRHPAVRHQVGLQGQQDVAAAGPDHAGRRRRCASSSPSRAATCRSRVSLPATAPLPADKDTGVNLDNQPFSSGPYKIAKNTPGVEIVLERNTNWDPATDPVRHQYPDKFVWTFGADNADARPTARIADNGDDAYALGDRRHPVELVAKVASDAALKDRTLLAPTPSAYRLSINTAAGHRPHGPPGAQLRHRPGGHHQDPRRPDGAVPITTLMPPTTHRLQEVRRLPGRRDRRPRQGQGAARRQDARRWSLGIADDTADAGDRDPAQEQPGEGRLQDHREDHPGGRATSTRSRRRPTRGTCTSTRGRRTGRAARRSCRCSSTAAPSRPRATATPRYVNDDGDQRRVRPGPRARPGRAGPRVGQARRADHEGARAGGAALRRRGLLRSHGSKVGGVFIGSIFGWPSFVNAYAKQ